MRDVGPSHVMIGSNAAGLLERGEILEDVEQLAGEVARTRSGRVLAIEGAAGIGKTALVGELCLRLAGVGMTVLRASGAELEADLAYGVVRQIFAPLAVADAPSPGIWSGAAALARPVVDPSFAGPIHVEPEAALHGLSWLCFALSERTPVAVVVDDAQWSDLSSLRWIAYLARRIADVPVLVILSSRPLTVEATATSRGQVLRALEEAASSIMLPGLSAEATARLVRGAIDPKVPDDVCQACFAATGGNPFYLHALISDGGAALITLDGAAVASMAPERTVRAVVSKLAALGAEAVRLARAIAVYGAPVALLLSARLADLDVVNAEFVADMLTSAGVLRDRRPPEFAHPILRSAVYRDVPAGMRTTLHRAAADILHDSGADPTVVGAALLPTEPHADRGVVTMLREAGAAARAGGDAHAAATYLERALREPPAPAVRSAVLLELGTAERRTLDPDAVNHLRLALQLADPDDRARIALELCRALNQPGDLSEAVGVISATAPSVRGSPELAALLEANQIGLASLHLTGRPSDTRHATEILRRLPTDAKPARLLRGVLAADALYRGQPISAVVAFLEPALSGDVDRLVGDVSLSCYIAFTAMMCERLGAAERLLDAALARAQAGGSAAAAGQLWAFRSQVYMRAGRLSDAEADARLAAEALQDLSLIAITPLPVHALIERDQSVEAATLLRHLGLAGELPRWLPSLVMITGRISLWTSLNDRSAAVGDLDEAERLAGRLAPECVVIPWRAEGALACLAAGDLRRGRALAEHNLELARAFGAPGVLATALRVAGIARGGEHGLKLLVDAVDAVAETQERLEHVKTLAALGAAQRRVGQRSAARRTLAEGLRLAEGCGAVAEANRVREELTIAGARQRRTHASGAAALTASQRRISMLAASGATNHEIAQALFLTPKTIERHLTNAYSTLGISSRKDLAAALAVDTADGLAPG